MSKKYVIEIKPEYEDTTKGVMVLGARESNLYVDTLSIEDLEELNSDYINEHFGGLQDEAYQAGLNDAWEAARKLFSSMADSDIEKAFPIEWNNGGFKALMNLQPQEAIAKLKAYEDKHSDPIKVGDEVTHKSDLAVWKAVCIRIDGDRQHMDLMGHTGAVGYYPVDDFKKTGRHFDISSILEELRNG